MKELLLMNEFMIKGIEAASALAKILLQNGYKVIITPDELIEDEYAFFEDRMYQVLYTEVDDL